MQAFFFLDTHSSIFSTFMSFSFFLCLQLCLRVNCYRQLFYLVNCY
uniref:Uncharacterized protein n=1 Tax=Arundo donax TaxID=35708 RepID=A0A0A9FCX8_ARUDO